MGEILVLVGIAALMGGGYLAGRVHGLYGYRVGYRFGYRQGYFDGDRAGWSRQHTDLASVSALLTGAPAGDPAAKGTTYTSNAASDDGQASRRVRAEWVLSTSSGDRYDDV